MGYSIICDARKGANLGVNTLALVDRQKNRSYFWTSDNASIILDYRKKSAAQFALKRLKYNNARIVPFSEAKRIILHQEIAIASSIVCHGTGCGGLYVCPEEEDCYDGFETEHLMR